MNKHDPNTPITKFEWALALTLFGIFALAIFGSHNTAQGATPTTTATWYGPGFYDHTTACGQHYDIRHRGVAVPSAGPYHLACGTRLVICHHHRCVTVRVTDTGGFRNHRFDLSARTAMDLCHCWKPYTMTVTYRIK